MRHLLSMLIGCCLVLQIRWYAGCTVLGSTASRVQCYHPPTVLEELVIADNEFPFNICSNCDDSPSVCLGSLRRSWFLYACKICGYRECGDCVLGQQDCVQTCNDDVDEDDAGGEALPSPLESNAGPAAAAAAAPVGMRSAENAASSTAETGSLDGTAVVPGWIKTLSAEELRVNCKRFGIKSELSEATRPAVERTLTTRLRALDLDTVVEVPAWIQNLSNADLEWNFNEHRIPCLILTPNTRPIAEKTFSKHIFAFLKDNEDSIQEVLRSEAIMLRAASVASGAPAEAGVGEAADGRAGAPLQRQTGAVPIPDHEASLSQAQQAQLTSELFDIMTPVQQAAFHRAPPDNQIAFLAAAAEAAAGLEPNSLLGNTCLVTAADVAAAAEELEEYDARHRTDAAVAAVASTAAVHGPDPLRLDPQSQHRAGARICTPSHNSAASKTPAVTASVGTVPRSAPAPVLPVLSLETSPGTAGGLTPGVLLTSGVLEQLYNGETPARLRLQMLSIRKTSKIRTSIDRYGTFDIILDHLTRPCQLPPAPPRPFGEKISKPAPCNMLC